MMKMGEVLMRVLVIQGAGMDRRGTEQVEVFGPETLDEINARISKRTPPRSASKSSFVKPMT